MYRSLDAIAKKESSEFLPYVVQGLVNGEIKAIFDGEQYLIQEEEYLLIRKMFRDFISR